MKRICRFDNGTLSRLLLFSFSVAACGTAAAQSFPIYEDGEAHTNSASQTTESELLINNGSSLVINSNATVQVGAVNMAEPSDNALSIVDDAVLYAGTTSFTAPTGSSLVIGNGSGALLMDNGSQLTATNFYMGASSDDTATAELSGKDTLLQIENTSFGTAGTGNEITISAGATFAALNSLTIGSGTSSNNYINVDNEGTLWVSSLTDIVNNSADAEDNTINIADGGTLEVGGDMKTSELSNKGLVLDEDAIIAVNGNLLSQTIDNFEETGLNLVLNTGSSSWNFASGNTYLGKFDSGNSLTLTNGASATLSTLQVGYWSTAAVNELLVTGNSSLSATNLVIGREGDGNSVSVADGSLYAESVVIGSKSGADSNTLTIKDGANVSIASDLTIKAGSNNTYKQTGGTNIVSGSVVMGSSDNSGATIGTNSYFQAQTLTVGNNGIKNYFKVKDGGYAHFLSDVVIGANTNKNYVQLSGSTNSTRLQIDGNLTVGSNGEENYLKVTSGTVSVSNDVQLGLSNGSNYITLNSSNALLDVTGDLYVGFGSSNNYVNVENGATALVHNVVIGNTAASSNNTISITGNNSLLSVGNTLSIGNENATNNSVTIKNGGALHLSSQTNINVYEDNFVYVNDGGVLQTADWDYAIETNALTNVVFNSGSTLEVGGSYTGPSEIQDGRAIALNGQLSTNSAAWDTGSEELYIGRDSANNTLSVRNDALATTGSDLILGYEAGADANSLVVTGESARVEIAGTLLVGRKGTGNSVTILDGGSITVTNLKMGAKSAGTGNSFLMVGESNLTASLNVSEDLHIGQLSSDNSFEASSNSLVTVGNDLVLGSDSDATGNSFFMGGSNAVLNVGNSLIVGQDGSGNTFDLSSNVTATIAGDLMIGSNSTDNAFTVDGDFTEVAVAGDFIISGTTNSSANTVSIGGSNTVFTVADDILLGMFGNNNTFSITNGATVNALSSFYLGGTNANNSLVIGGTNSALSVTDNLIVGDTEADNYNLLGVYNAASLEVFSDLTMNNGELDIHNSTASVGGNYTQEEDATLSITISDDFTGTNLVVAGTASFAEDTSLSITRDATVPDYIENGETNELARTIVAASGLQIAEEEATTDLLYSELNIIENAVFDFELTITNNTIVLDNFSTRSLSFGLEGSAKEIAALIEGLADENSIASSMYDTLGDMSLDEKNTVLGNYYGEKQSTTPAHNIINMSIGSVAEKLTMRADNTRSRIIAEQSTGTAGPHAAGQELQGWFAAFSTQVDQGEDNAYSAYDGDVNGHMIGADFTVAEHILVGIAGGRSSGDIEQESGGATETDSSYGAAYLSIGTESWFADASVIYGSSSVDLELGSTFDTTASYDAKNMALHLGLGKEITGDYLIFTPQFSMLANYYEQDAYTEEATTALAREIGSFDQLYLQSSIGFSLGMYMGLGEMTMKPEIYAHWQHEFNAANESIPFQLIDQTGTLTLQAPEEDIFKIGIGSSVKLGEYLELRADLDTRQSTGYSDYTATGSLRYQF